MSALAVAVASVLAPAAEEVVVGPAPSPAGALLLLLLLQLLALLLLLLLGAPEELPVLDGPEAGFPCELLLVGVLDVGLGGAGVAFCASVGELTLDLIRNAPASGVGVKTLFASTLRL